MTTNSNHKLPLLPGQYQLQVNQFVSVSLMMLVADGLIFLFSTPQQSVNLWLMGSGSLALILLLLSLYRLFRVAKGPDVSSATPGYAELLLLVLSGGIWGSLFGVFSDAKLFEEAKDGLWLTLLLMSLVLAVFSNEKKLQLTWLTVVILPLLVYMGINFNAVSLNALVTALLAVLLFFILLFSGEKRLGFTRSAQNPQHFDVLKKEHDDLLVAFSAQDAAISAETALRQAVEESLRQANLVAESANRSKTEFMATIGHEIRTPLNGIIPILEMLSLSRLDEEQQQLVKTAFNSSTHLLRIINDILDFSKAEVGKLEIESHELDLNELVFSVADLMKRSAESKKLQLNVHIAPDVPHYVRGDSLRLKQIITNLLSNALKFTEKGEVSIEVTLRESRIREVELMFAVRDTGIGMNEQATQKLFRSFTQADASTTRIHGGTGLGLAICKRLVELMGGQIGVKSSQGKGSLFWFVLPMRKSVREVPALKTTLNGTRMLFYTSNVNLLDDFRYLLDECKVEYQTSHQLDKVTEIIKYHKNVSRQDFLDLLVVDLFGIEVNAVEEIRYLKQQISDTVTRLMVINTLPHLEQVLRSEGADVVISRPFNLEVFKRNLYRLLDVESDHTFQNTTMPESLTQDLTNVERLETDELVDGDIVRQTQPAFKGCVLLVEDNPVNLGVAKKMMQILGLEVDVSLDGKQALSAMEQKHYDLVFMDCLMPVMDGFASTRQRRKMESLESDKPAAKIIAMTANVMRGDREKCIRSGMNDFLPKPLTLTSVAAMLAKWLPEQSVNFPEIEEDQVEQSMDAAGGLINTGVIGELQHVMGDDFKSIIHTYLQHASKLIVELRHKADEGDMEAVIRAVHSFKSSSKNVGAIELGEKARVLEEKLRKKVPVNLVPEIQSLLKDYDKVVKALGNYL